MTGSHQSMPVIDILLDIIPYKGIYLYRAYLFNKVFMHPSHKDNLGKLNRVSGQVEAIKRMIDEQQYCVDIMTQIRAARSALKSIELSVLATHMQSCLSDCCPSDKKSQAKQIKEILALLRKYE